MTLITRCDWVKEGIHLKYHDAEWGVPLHRDRNLFEFLLLDGAQAGLSWMTILKRRSAYRKAFDNFNPEEIASYKKSDVNSILKDEGIIRNRKKVESFVNNAKRFLEVKDEFRTFDEYVWQFTDFETIENKFKTWSEIPSFSRESELMSKDLKRRGFTFVGPTICYAFMQSVGMVNDHTVTCFRHNEIRRMR